MNDSAEVDDGQGFRAEQPSRHARCPMDCALNEADSAGLPTCRQTLQTFRRKNKEESTQLLRPHHVMGKSCISIEGPPESGTGVKPFL